MAQYSSNGMFTSINGVDVSAFWTGTTGFTHTNSPTDVSAGANATHEEFNAGLDATGLTMSLSYDDTQATRATYISQLKPRSKITVIHGPQGNTTGMPVHEQVMLIQSNTGPNTGQKADTFSTFDLTFLGAAAPVRNIYDDVFA